MKKRVAVLVFGLVFAALADVTTLPTNCLLNLTTKDTTTGYTLDSICSKYPNLEYDFYWTYYDYGTCLCSCLPFITIGSPHPFYLSKRAMDGSEFTNIAQLQDTTLFLKCSTATYPFSGGCKMASRQFNCLIPNDRDTLCTRLFVLQTKNGNYMGNYMPLKIRSIHDSIVPCPYLGISRIIDSLTVAYGIATPVEPRMSVSSQLARIHSIRSGRLTTVSGRSVHGPALSPGTFIDGNKKTLRIKVLGTRVLGTELN